MLDDYLYEIIVTYKHDGMFSIKNKHINPVLNLMLFYSHAYVPSAQVGFPPCYTTTK